MDPLANTSPPAATPALAKSEPEQLMSLAVNVVALLLLTMSVTMLADFTRRLFGADPDSAGLLAIAVQAAFTVAATGTFTEAGWALMRRSLGRDVQAKASWRLGLSALLFLAAAAMWLWMPGWLAQIYNSRAYNLDQTLAVYQRSSNAEKAKTVVNPGTLRAEVLRNYQRAAALDPSLGIAHTNAGKLLEDFYRYSEAEKEYRQAIFAEGPQTVDLVAYANLAGDLIRDGKPLDALAVIGDAQNYPVQDPMAGPALARNKARAEFALGFYAATVRDTSPPDSAASACVLAQAQTKLGHGAEARAAWLEFSKRFAVLTQDDPVVDPECSLLEEASHEKH